MIALIGKEWGFDETGHPIRYHVYMASGAGFLPGDAPVGSRAVFDDGKTAFKTSAGWAQE